MTPSQLVKLQAKWQDQWLRLEGVVGVAITRHHSQLCLTVYTNAEAADLRNKIPHMVEGITVNIVANCTFNARRY